MVDWLASTSATLKRYARIKMVSRSSAAWMMCVERAVLIRLADYRRLAGLNGHTMLER